MRPPSELTKRQLWFRIVRRSRKMIVELEQMIRDANHYSGLPVAQSAPPYDMEPDRILLHKVKTDLAEFLRRNPTPPTEDGEAIRKGDE